MRSRTDRMTIHLSDWLLVTRGMTQRKNGRRVETYLLILRDDFGSERGHGFDIPLGDAGLMAKEIAEAARLIREHASE